MEYVITTSMLSKTYGKCKALDEITMHIPKGSIYGFVGKNGAGKTTLIRMITGISKPTSGGYSLYGIENSNKEVSKMRRRVGAVVEKPSLYPNMTARDNLKQQSILLGLLSKESIQEVLELVGLEKLGNKKVKDFSLGMKQRLAIAKAIIGNPDFLILDEPVNGLDPQGIVEIRELLLKLNKEKQITILITSHFLDELSKIATDFGFIHKGRLIKEISASELEMSLSKYLQLEVNDCVLLTRALDKHNIGYEVLSDNTAKVYTEMAATKLIHILEEENCEVISINKKEESLEHYFINLVGGERDE